MRLAVFHNYMDNIGGAEMVGLSLAREFGADLFTTNFDRDKADRMGFADVPVRSIGRVPLNAPFKQQLSSLRFRLLDLAGHYDAFIIDGDWAVAAAVNNHPCVWYVHSPIREIWDLCRYTRQQTVPVTLRVPFDFWVAMNRHLNRRWVDRVARVVCNSRNTRDRVRRYLERDAEVIYPPVDTNRFHYRTSGDYWLSVNRLISHKRVELQIEAFRRMPEERLVVVGCFEQSRHFRACAERIAGNLPANVSLRHWVSADELVNLYADCRGFVTTALDEDLGLTAIEAMASGKPVVAPNEGGYRETVVDGETGALINGLTVGRLVDAIRRVGTGPDQYREACLRRGRAFDASVFFRSMRRVIESVV